MKNAPKSWSVRIATWGGVAALALATGTSSAPVGILPSAATLACTITGTAGSDVLTGTAHADVICGLGGNDRIAGRGGNDVLRGGPGNDVLDGGDGADRIYGGTGVDRMAGGAGADWIRGRSGNDIASGGPGNDVVFGGAGSDQLTGGAGTDKLLGGSEDDVLRDVDAATTVDRLECGLGSRDRAYANRADLLFSCESRTLAGSPPPAEHAPVAVDDVVSTTEDTVLVLPLTGAGSPAANDTDADGGTRTVTAVSAADGGAVEIIAGEIRFTPDEDLCGEGAGGFDYTVADPTGRQDTGHVTVDITCAPDEPVAVDDDVTVSEDADAAVLDVLANDTDADGDDLDPEVVTQPAHGSAAVADGDVTYTPDANYCNTPPGTDPDAFTYRLSPSGTPATVTVTVSCVDDAPHAVDDEYLLDEDDPATALTVLANDTDVDAGSISISATSQPANGAVGVTGGGTGLTYTPAADYCNDPPGTTTDTFTYTLAPGGSTATVSVVVNCVEDAAVAHDDEVTVAEDAAPATLDLLANDEAGDGASPTVTAVSPPAHGTAVLSSGTVTYQPNANYCNESPDVDTFTYTISGGSSAAVSVHVTCVNDAPSAAPLTFSAASAAVGNTTLVVDDPSDGAPALATPHKTVTGDLLAGASDVETPGSVAVVGDTIATDQGGTVTLEADGDFTYVPPPGCTGTADTFTYELTDGDATGQADATVEFSGCVWYVDNDATGDSGTSAAPFDTVAQAVAASAAGQTLYVAEGDGTTTGYDAGVVLKSGQHLVGSVVDLEVDGYVLAAGVAGERPLLTRSGGDVVDLATGNLVTGVAIDPSGAGGGIAGTAGDGNATVSDVRIVDTGTAGTQPALELDGTSGSSSVADLVVDTSAASGTTSGSIGVRLSSAGTVVLAPSSAVTIRVAGARGLVVASTAVGTSAVDSVTVTGSSSGAVDLASVSGSLTFGDLALTTTGGTQAAFAAQGTGALTVPSAATADISATGGPAVDVTSAPGAGLAFDTVSSTASATDGVNLDGLAAGSFSATGGSLSGASGIAFDVNGGSGDVSYAGAIADGTGASAEITGRTGGTVTLSGSVADTADAGGGISLSGNSGGSTVFSGSSKVLRTEAAAAVSMTASDGHTLRLTDGGLAIVTSTGNGLDALNSGTVVVSGTGNAITTMAGGRALGVVNTDIGADGITLQQVSSDLATNGIVLDGTGSSGSLTVTGNGGLCTAADTAGCTGGEIASTTGADSASTTPGGTGIVLHDTQAPSLTRMWIHDNTNYAIRGDAVRGLTLANSVVNGTNGDNDATPYDDSSILLTNLTGSAAITATVIAGGLQDNLRVANTSGSLSRLTLDQVVLPVAGTRPGNDAVSIESTGTAGALEVTVTGSTFASAKGDLLQVVHAGSGTGDVVLTGNTFDDGHPAVATGGGGISLYQSGTAGTTTMAVSGNTIRNAAGTAVLVVKDAGGSVQRGTFATNTIGIAGTPNSGSAAGSGLQLQTVGGGTSTWAVTNNQIRGYNNFGILVLAGGGASPQSGTFNTTVTGNTIAEPGTLDPGFSRQGVHYNIGTVPDDSFLACAAITGNTLAASGADTVLPVDVRLRQRQDTTIRLPGYAGATNDDTGVQTFVAGNNATGGPTVLATQTVATGGGGFTGGAACPTP
ncbi:MAG TPA: Ig-like domain-containing protein [Nocardioides sp.]|nr:Ig-like domain-containing protein [Nocardioides sp.]